MKLPILLALSGLATTQLNLHAQFFTAGHGDIGIAYEGGFDLHFHDGEADVEYAPGDISIVIGPAALATVPPPLAAFGTVGAPIWILPKTETEGLPFLGLGTEELNAADWTGPLTLTLKSVSGPGDFGLYNVGTFGEVIPLLNSRDGITAADRLSLTPGSHAHFNYTFNAPGTYTVGFEATGLHAVDGAVSSGTVEYTFIAVPEPESWSLLVIGGGAALAFWRRHRRV